MHPMPKRAQQTILDFLFCFVTLSQPVAHVTQPYTPIMARNEKKATHPPSSHPGYPGVDSSYLSLQVENEGYPYPPMDPKNSTRRPTKTATVDIKVPMCSSITSYRSATTLAVSDDLLSNISSVVKELIRSPEGIEQLIQQALITEDAHVYKHRIDLGNYYRHLNEDVLRYRFVKYNQGDFWQGLSKLVSIVKDSATTMYLATASLDTSNMIAGRSFILDMEHGIQDFTVPQHSPHAENYFITFECVPDAHL